MKEANRINMEPFRQLWSTSSIITMIVVSFTYLLVSEFLVGFKPDQLFLVALVNVLYFLSQTTRKLIIGFSIFIVYWVVFDYMKAFPNYQYSEVRIGSLYELEKSAFGFISGGERLTPNEYWVIHQSTFLDILSGIFYLTWVPVPMGFAIYLFFKKRDQFIYFSLSFLLINLLGFVVYYVYPAAPPWYIQQYGLQFIAHTPGNTAGLGRFDTYFGVTIFKSIYEKSSNVFAAMPSLHSSYPVLVLYYGVKNRLGFINILFVILTLGIWCSAVYSIHHYVLDVLAGLLCAIIGISLFNILSKKSSWINSLNKRLIKATA